LALLFWGRLLKNGLFLAMAAGLLLVIPLQLIYSHSMGNPGDLLHTIQSATTETGTISRSDYLLTQVRVVATYLRLLVLPVNQNLDYDYPVYHSLFDPPVLAALLLHITLAGLAVILFIRSRRQTENGDPASAIRMRLACLGILWFYLALSVESSLVPIRDVIYEHRVYLPSVGFFMVIAAGFSACRPRDRKVLTGVAVLICFVLTAGTIVRNRRWSDEMALWQDTLLKSPNKARPNYSVGLLYYRRYMPEKALPRLVRALELDPARPKHWDTLNAAISIIKGYEGRSSAGREYQTVPPTEMTAWLANSHNSLGLAYEYLGNRYLARENYRKATSLDPSLDLAWYNLALLSAHQNDIPSMASSLRSLKAVNPKLEALALKTIHETLPSVQFVFQ
jgi:tetratricopeptide (TPR) repeat protein